MAKWSHKINNFIGGFSPGYFLGDFPSFGNRNQAGKMLNCDLIDPSGLTQGKGLATLTGGNQAGNLTTLIKGLLDKVISANLTYGVGGNRLYPISPTAVSAPRIIDHPTAVGEDGEDVVLFRGKVYYSYNHSAGGDVGRLTLPSTFIDNFLSTFVPGGFTLENAPHQLEVAEDHIFIANGRFVSLFSGTVATRIALDIHQDAVIQSIVWTQHRLWISANRPNVAGANKMIGSVYVWDGKRISWEEEIRIMGRVGALYVKNGVPHLFYQDLTGVSKLAVIDGVQIRDLTSFEGDLPRYYQVSEYKGFIIWSSGNRIFAFGAVLPKLPGLLFQLASTGWVNSGGLSAPFGVPMTASAEGANFRLARFSGFETNSNWKSMLVDISKSKTGKGFIEKVIVNFNPMAVGARVDIRLNCNLGTSIWTGTISRALDGTAIQKIFNPNRDAHNFRVEFDFTNGSAVNNVFVRSVLVEGNFPS